MDDIELWNALSDIEQQFFKAETEEERLALLEEGLKLADMHGLIPEDLSVEEAKQQVMDAYSDPEVLNEIRNLINGNVISSGSSNTLKATTPTIQKMATINTGKPDLIIVDMIIKPGNFPNEQ